MKNNFKKYLVISFGNYETKLMLGSVDDNDCIRILYTDTINTKDCISSSMITNKEKLIESIKDKLNKINQMFNVQTNKVILNLPLKEFFIFSEDSEEFHLKKTLNKKQWFKILEKTTYQHENKNQYFIDKKINSWNLDGFEYSKPPFNIDGEKLKFKIQFYYANEDQVRPYINLVQECGIENYQILHDPLALQLAFDENLRQNKMLLNIGHNIFEIILYKNKALIHRKKIEFGIKNLTEEISNKLNVTEEQAINILKDYNDCLVAGDSEIPFAIILGEKYKSFASFHSKTLNMIISKWLMTLVTYVNDEIEKKHFELDEIYIQSSLDFFEKWINYIKAKLSVKNIVPTNMNIFIIKNNSIGISENKFNSLYYSIMYAIEKEKC